ncbi:MAG: methylmalonyl Co-A mutase-associated GTPase MeaB [Deltaproteobacteria bacterium]|nr:methylmalonyl Co-A mutase-associated GTPase MeaB [Deltaproteobacteria bacterium]
MTAGTQPASLAALVDGVVAGDRRVIARALRVVDDLPAEGRRLASLLYPHRKGARLVGITGNPGAGKSTLVDGLIQALRARGSKVAVLAVDPSSPFSGGALLGDRIRMSRHAGDDGVYVRSLATRGALGGLSRAAFDSTRVLDAAGFDVILLETVGVGQDEVDVARLAHTTVVVLVPGLGDDIQAAKAGLLEVADVFVVNKADRDGADEVERALRQMLALASGAAAWVPPILRAVATRAEGIAELVNALDEHRRHATTDAGRERLKLQSQEIFERLLDAALVDVGRRNLGARLQVARAELADHDLDPYALVQALVDDGAGDDGC